MNFNMQQPFSGVVRHLIIINVLMFFGTMLVLGDSASGIPGMISHELERYYLAAFMPGSPYFQPFQLATYMFMHGDIFHLAFNMFTLFFFGPMVEMVWGHQRFLLYYLFCGIGAYALYMATQWYQFQQTGDISMLASPMLGASGAVFGVMTAFAFHFPDRVLRLLFPPIEVKAKYFVPVMAVFELIYGVQGNATGIAHFAHLGGAVAGFLLIGFWTRFRFR